MSQKFQVTVNGRTYTRKSENRTYTHAIVALQNYDRAHKRAHGWTAAEQRQAEENFQFYRDQADGTWWTRHGWTFNPDTDAAKQAEALKVVAAGIDAYIAQGKADKVAALDDCVRKGRFRWVVLGWAGSRRLADARVKTNLNHGFYQACQAIPVGAVVSLPEDANLEAAR